MPLTLRPPRPGKTPNWEIRGTFRGCLVETSSRTDRRSDALVVLRAIEDCIRQHGTWPEPEPEAPAGDQQPGFTSAAVAYLEAGGPKRYVARLIRYFGNTPLQQIDQAAIDAAGIELAPNVTPATRNAYVYTPLSAIMHHALGDACPVIRRPKGAKGRVKTDFLWPTDAFAIIAEADAIDAEFGLYLRLLLYTGIRKSEGLALLSGDTRPEELSAWLRTSKNEDPRMLKLRADIVAPLQAHLEAHPERERLFRFREGGHFKHMLLRARLAACGLPCPKRRPTGWTPPPHRLAFVGFHTFRHTWSTWMRRYGGADLQGLVATGNWRDPRSAARYSHVVARDEWDRVDALPSIKRDAPCTIAAMKVIPSFPAYSACSDGHIWRNGHVLKERSNGKGYLQVTLSIDGKTCDKYVHRLVCEAFEGECPPHHECRHLNGIRSANQPGNLKWSTKAENEADKVAHGTINSGERNGQAQLTEELVMLARHRVAGGEQIKDVAADLGMRSGRIRDAVRGKKWRHLPNAVRCTRSTAAK